MAYARSLLPKPEDAEDILQDCFCRILAKVQDYDLRNDGTKILYRAITNACINLKTRRKTVFSIFQRDAGSDSEFVEDPVDPKVHNPQDVIAGKELHEAVQVALRQLPTLQRAAIELRSLGHSQQDIADILETTSTNVGVMIHRARQQLAKLLAPFMLGGEIP